MKRRLNKSYLATKRKKQLPPDQGKKLQLNNLYVDLVCLYVLYPKIYKISIQKPNQHIVNLI